MFQSFHLDFESAWQMIWKKLVESLVLGLEVSEHAPGAYEQRLSDRNK